MVLNNNNRVVESTINPADSPPRDGSKPCNEMFEYKYAIGHTPKSKVCKASYENNEFAIK